MLNENPIIMQRALALLQHHAESESKDSAYTVSVFPQVTWIGSGDRYIDHRIRYSFNKYFIDVWVRWDHLNDVYWNTSKNLVFDDESNPEIVLGVAGMLVKAGNLMRQLKALQ